MLENGKEIGNYRINSHLATSGMARIYIASRVDDHTNNDDETRFRGASSTNQSFAFKTLKEENLKNSKIIYKFFDEAVILSTLNHPNIVKLYRFFPYNYKELDINSDIEINNYDSNQELSTHSKLLEYTDENQHIILQNYAIVMEYIRGKTLKQIISGEKRKVSKDFALNLCKQILSALHYAYVNGVLHRDIKSSNIMIEHDTKKVKIIDFGIGKLRSEHTQGTSTEAFSTKYSPPERLDIEIKVSPDQAIQSDIYSLGIVFYELFSGGYPFRSDLEIAQIMTWHSKIRPKPIKGIPSNINRAILKSLNKKIEDRFYNFEEFARALNVWDEKYIQETQTKSPISSLPEKKSKLNIILFSIIAFVVIVPLLYFSFDYWQKREYSNSKDNSIMVPIPKGEFIMGSDRYPWEAPIQTIYLDRYSIDKYLITNNQFEQFVRDTGYRTDAEKNNTGRVQNKNGKFEIIPGAMWKKPDGFRSIQGKGNYPVVQVSYNDALNYCQWAGKDLPTEAQWEKAAKGTKWAIFPWGFAKPDKKLANYGNHNGEPSPVNKYPKGKSIYNVFDMAGNVYQWCKDWYGTGRRKFNNPNGSSKSDMKKRVLKGSSYKENIDSLYVSGRIGYEMDFSSSVFGFRCVEKQSAE